MNEHKTQVIIEGVDKTQPAKTGLEALKEELGKLGSTGKNLSALFGTLRNTIATAFLGREVIQGISAIYDETEKLQNSLMGLRSISKYVGEDFGDTKAAATSLASDGLLTVREAAQGLKTLLSAGMGLEQATSLMERLKDQAVFNRQAHYELGQAVVVVTEGIKNENSILADATGTTKNLALMYKEYARAHGKSVDELTQGERVLAAYNGFMKESEASIGDAARAADTLTGSKASLRSEISQLKTDLGEKLTPAFVVATQAVTDLVRGIRSLISATSEAGSGMFAGLESGLDSFAANVAGKVASVEESIGRMYLALGLPGAAQPYLDRTAATRAALANRGVDVPGPHTAGPLEEVGPRRQPEEPPPPKKKKGPKDTSEAANRELAVLMAGNQGQMQQELARIDKHYEELKAKGANLVNLEKWKQEAIAKIYAQEDKDTVKYFEDAAKNYERGVDLLEDEIKKGERIFEDKRKALGMFTPTEEANMATDQAIEGMLTDIEAGLLESQNGIKTWNDSWDSAFTGIKDGFKAVSDRIGTEYDMWVSMGQQTSQNMHQAFNDTFLSALKGDLTNLGNVWQNFWNSMLGVFSNYFANQMTKAFNTLMGKLTESATDWVSKLFDWISGINWGGIAGGASTGGGAGIDATVDAGPSFKVQAMHQGGKILRYHGGGGLKNDEVLLKGQEGEHMLSREDVDFVNKVKGSGGGNVSVVVNLKNESGAQLSATTGAVRKVDNEKWVVDLILRNLSRGGELRGALMGA